MAQLISIPVLLILLGLQISVSDKFSIFNGFADLILLWLSAWIVQSKIKHGWVWFLVAILLTSYISGLQWYVIVAGYSFVFILGIFIKKRLWQSPLLSFYLVLIIGCLVFNFITFYSLTISGINLELKETFKTIIMPSLLLNLLFSIPIYLIAKDLTFWLFPYEEAE
jgi:hypothetical protein